MDTFKVVMISILVLVLGIVGFLANGFLSTSSQATSLEASIQAQWPVCLTVIDTTYQTVRTQNQIADAGAQDIKDYLERIFLANDEGEQATASTNLVTAVAQYSVLGTTDLNELRVRVMQTVEAGLMGDWRSCMARMADLKREYSVLIGLPAGAIPGQWGAFPNSMFAKMAGVPRYLVAEAPSSPPRDLDGDFRLTAFDYPSSVLSGVGNEILETGELPDLLP